MPERATSLSTTVKAMIRAGDTPDAIAAHILRFVTEASVSQKEYLQDLNRTGRLFASASLETQRTVFAPLVRGGGAQIGERLMMRSRRSGLKLNDVPSFTASMNRRAFQKVSKAGTIPETRLIGSKLKGYEFADSIGARRPLDPSERTSIDQVNLKPGFAVKPLGSEGGRGVYLVHDEDDIQAVVTGDRFSGYDELRRRMRVDQEQSATINNDWYTEEIVYEDTTNRIPARDLKFFCFYGSCPLILEVIRTPNIGYTFWNPDHSKPKTGMYRSLDFEGIGFTQEAYDEALRISSSIPAPFLRIDFLNGEGGPVLGEFTGHPGNFEDFPPGMDRKMGQEFLKAELRLSSDLLHGKTFPFFQDPKPTLG